jgi:hypothetical protein
MMQDFQVNSTRMAILKWYNFEVVTLYSQFQPFEWTYFIKIKDQ